MRKVVMILVVLGLVNVVAATTAITTHMTVDDAFDLYLSTDDNQIGTLIGSGSDYRNTFTLGANLITGFTNYVHVIGTDIYGHRAAFIGDFSLSGTSFKFLNDSQSLVTDREYWSISNVGFGQDYYKPDEIGLNGISPWGSRPGISSSAFFIWSNDGYDLLTSRYFSTAIIPVPEPATLCLLGLGGLALLRKRRA